MSFRDLVVSGVALAKSLTQPLQPQVIVRRWIGQTEFGTDQYHADELYTALVEKKVQAVRGPGGQEVLARSYVAFLEPIPSLTLLLGLEPGKRTDPFDEQDVIILPDGETGPILAIEGFIDAETSSPYLSEVWLG